MVSVGTVEAIVAELPEVGEKTSYGNRSWTVRDKVFAWIRSFSKADLKRFGDEPVPGGPILAVRVEDLMEKDALLAEGRPGHFTIPHFDGYAAVLIQLDEADPDVAGVLRSINLDESHWDDPTAIRLDRREGTHAAFALGPHRCLGEWLGRQEVRVGVERLFARFPDLALDPAHDVDLRGFEFRGPTALWVVPDGGGR